jgi:hypothetical protein
LVKKDCSFKAATTSATTYTTTETKSGAVNGRKSDYSSSDINAHDIGKPPHLNIAVLDSSNVSSGSPTLVPSNYFKNVIIAY